MAVHYVGTTTQFAHHEQSSGGGALPAQPGSWYSTNTAVATITQGGLASWLAAGATDIVFVVTGQNRFATYPVTVHSAIPATLTLTPTTVHLYPNSVQRVTVTALDSGSVPIADLDLDSVVTSDPTVATIIQLETIPGQPPAFLIVGVGVGTCTVTVQSGSVSAQNNVDVIAVVTQSLADARYRQLSVVVPASDVAKDIPVDHSMTSGTSGALAIVANAAARAHRIKMSGDLTVTLSGIALWDYAFLDVYQDGTGNHIFTLVGDVSLPPFRYDSNITPDETPDGNYSDSYMIYREPTRCSVVRTWKKVAAS